MSRFTLKWVDGQYKVSLPGIETMDVVPAAEFDELLKLLEVYASSVGCSFVGIENWHKARALIAKHRGQS